MDNRRRASTTRFQRQLDHKLRASAQPIGTDLRIRLLRQCHEEPRPETTSSAEPKVRRQADAFVAHSYANCSGVPSETNLDLARFVILVGMLSGICDQLRNE
jgi:hypothetical protein